MLGTWPWVALERWKYWFDLCEIEKKEVRNIDLGLVGLHIKGMFVEKLLIIFRI